MSSQLVTSFRRSPAAKGLQISMWHPPSKPTATSTFRVNKVQRKKVPEQDLLKNKLSASLRGNGGVDSPSSNEDCFPVSKDVPKSALFLSLTSAISSQTPPSMQGMTCKNRSVLDRLVNLTGALELDNHTDIINTIEDTPGPAKDLDEPTCRVSECTEKECSALRSKLDHNNSSNIPRLSSGNTAGNHASKSMFVCMRTSSLTVRQRRQNQDVLRSVRKALLSSNRL
jgi:hypothetical protein